MPLPANYSLPKSQANPDAPKITYDPLPEDTFQVEIVDITPAVSTYAKTGDERAVLKITSVVLNDDYDFDGPENGEQKARGRRLWFEVPEIPLYPPKQGGKPTSLYTFVSAVVGHPLTRDECRNFSPENMLNKQLRVLVTQKVSQNTGKAYNKVTAHLPVRKMMTPFDPDEFKAAQAAADAAKTF